MVFSKKFPKQTEGSYTTWEEVKLSSEEEQSTTEECRMQNFKIMQECLHDAIKIVNEEELKDYQSDIVKIAIAFFEKRASHEIYWKENKAKEKFEESKIKASS